MNVLLVKIYANEEISFAESFNLYYYNADCRFEYLTLPHTYQLNVWIKY